MKHIIYLFFAFFTCINTSEAQVTISTSDLMGTKWQTARQYDNQSKDYDEYTQGIKIWHKSDGSTGEYPYYLSETKPTRFDYSKVGVITKGRYIVMTIPKWGDLLCFFIKDFYDGTMVLENEFEGGETLNIKIPSNKPRNQLSKQKSKSKW